MPTAKKAKPTYRYKKWTEDGRKWVVEKCEGDTIIERFSFDSEENAAKACKRMRNEKE